MFSSNDIMHVAHGISAEVKYQNLRLTMPGLCNGCFFRISFCPTHTSPTHLPPPSSIPPFTFYLPTPQKISKSPSSFPITPSPPLFPTLQQGRALFQSPFRFESNNKSLPSNQNQGYIRSRKRAVSALAAPTVYHSISPPKMGTSTWRSHRGVFRGQVFTIMLYHSHMDRAHWRIRHEGNRGLGGPAGFASD